MLIKVLQIFVLSVLSGVLYRAGGYGRPFDGKYRDFGCAFLACLTIHILGIRVGFWIHLIHFILLFSSLTTYHDYLAKEKGKEDLRCWLATGFCYGLSAIPIAIVTGLWLGFWIRTVVLAILTMIWSETQSKVELEEGGRGFLIVATLPLLLI